MEKFDRRKFLYLFRAPLIIPVLMACSERKPEKTPLSKDHVEFFSNGGVLNIDNRLKITAHPERLNALVTEPNGGLRLPEGYIITMVIAPTLQAGRDSLANIRSRLEPAIQARFPKQLTNRGFTILFITSQDAVETALRAYIPTQPVKSKTSIDLDPKKITESISNILSAQWFLTMREQYAGETGLPRPPRQLPSKIAELIVKAPPIEVVEIKGSFGN